MEERIEKDTEVLEENVYEVPEELKKYLEKDTEIKEKLENTIDDLNSEIVSLNTKRVETEKEFDDILTEFKERLEKEKAAVFEEFRIQEQGILDNKTKVESIKKEEADNKEKYVQSLKEISNVYNSKISSIEEAIKACSDNESLTKALEEEKNKMVEALENEYSNRKEALNNVLVEIGEKKEEPVVETKVTFEPTIEPSFEPKVSLEPVNEDPIRVTVNKSNISEEFDTEVVSHENREDVINVIYESEDVMEGHVFPFLRSLM